MGFRCTAARRAAADVCGSRWSDTEYSTGAEPVHAGDPPGMLGAAEWADTVSGPGDYAKANGDSKNPTGERKYGCRSRGNSGETFADTSAPEPDSSSDQTAGEPACC